jgi:hypothetical protein
MDRIKLAENLNIFTPCQVSALAAVLITGAIWFWQALHPE